MPEKSRSSSDGTAQKEIPAPLPTTDDASDYAVLLDGEPLKKSDAGGFPDEAYVICEAEVDGDMAEIWVTYGESGVTGVTVDWIGKDLSMGLDAADEQPESGMLFEGGSLGIEATVELKPVNEVSL